ncbi:MAG: type III pantothenate kinase [Casimicrobiaceae bacterium]|nr:type III pantothenate kinase [Casimicrobiaceae bacterium]MCX8098465.1 type III pantothenate kinase [Casimicrobiaceae bacterium]MDW8311569.1 type III pantothenate kinase [Burkholderiales bacterium]
MLLALDVGNTRLKWALMKDLTIAERGSMFVAEVDDLVARFGFDRRRIERVVGSCVASHLTRERLERQFRALGREIEWIRATASACGVVNRYDDPARLGTDRWAALVAAFARGLAPCVVASAGTALTVDQLDADGQFLGGAIVAGYHAMLGGLAGNTAALSVDAGEWSPQPRNTRDALATGAIDAMVGAIERGRLRLETYRRERGDHGAVRLVLTGGSAYRLLPYLPPDTVAVEALCLEGVARIAQTLTSQRAAAPRHAIPTGLLNGGAAR